MVSASADTSNRPRERLDQLGAGALSDVELLALVIGHGHRNRSALAMARSLLYQGGLRELARRESQEWRPEPGVGAVSAARLAALFELARRLAGPAPARQAQKFPDDTSLRMALSSIVSASSFLSRRA